MTYKRSKCSYTFKVYKKGKRPIATQTIEAHNYKEAYSKVEYEYWTKGYNKPILELISSTRLQEWCLFYLTEEGKDVIEHHLYIKAFSLKEAKKQFKNIIENIPKGQGYFLYVSKELRKLK